MRETSLWHPSRTPAFPQIEWAEHSSSDQKCHETQCVKLHRQMLSGEQHAKGKGENYDGRKNALFGHGHMGWVQTAETNCLFLNSLVG